MNADVRVLFRGTRPVSVHGRRVAAFDETNSEIVYVGWRHAHPHLSGSSATPCSAADRATSSSATGDEDTGDCKPK